MSGGKKLKGKLCISVQTLKRAASSSWRAVCTLQSCYTQALYTPNREDWLPSDVANSAAVILNPVGLSLWLSTLAKVLSLVLGPKMKIKPGQVNNGQK